MYVSTSNKAVDNSNIDLYITDSNKISTLKVVNGKSFNNQDDGIWLDAMYAKKNGYQLNDQITLKLSLIHICYSDEELDDLKTKIGEGAKYSIQRYKGLGEMNAEQLWETTMDPEKRILNQIDLDEAMEADMIFDMLMGEKVEPRREFIQENAKYVTDLDI